MTSKTTEKKTDVKSDATKQSTAIARSMCTLKPQHFKQLEMRTRASSQQQQLISNKEPECAEYIHAMKPTDPETTNILVVLKGTNHENLKKTRWQVPDPDSCVPRVGSHADACQHVDWLPVESSNMRRCEAQTTRSLSLEMVDLWYIRKIFRLTRRNKSQRPRSADNHEEARQVGAGSTDDRFLDWKVKCG